jgi:hypothetical protein
MQRLKTCKYMTDPSLCLAMDIICRFDTENICISCTANLFDNLEKIVEVMRETA